MNGEPGIGRNGDLCLAVHERHRGLCAITDISDKRAVDRLVVTIRQHDIKCERTRLVIGALDLLGYCQTCWLRRIIKRRVSCDLRRGFQFRRIIRVGCNRYLDLNKIGIVIDGRIGSVRLVYIINMFTDFIE